MNEHEQPALPIVKRSCREEYEHGDAKQKSQQPSQRGFGKFGLIHDVIAELKS